MKKKHEEKKPRWGEDTSGSLLPRTFGKFYRQTRNEKGKNLFRPETVLPPTFRNSGKGNKSHLPFLIANCSASVFPFSDWCERMFSRCLP